MHDDDADISAIKREWLAARIVVIGGFAITIAFGAYAGLTWRAQLQHARTQAAIAKDQQASKEQQANLSAERAFCRALLSQTQKLGLVPNFAELTKPVPTATKKTGRYTCEASTGATNYAMTADLMCRNLKSATCVSLYEVALDGKTILFQRHD